MFTIDDDSEVLQLHQIKSNKQHTPEKKNARTHTHFLDSFSAISATYC